MSGQLQALYAERQQIANALVAINLKIETLERAHVKEVYGIEVGCIIRVPHWPRDTRLRVDRVKLQGTDKPWVCARVITDTGRPGMKSYELYDDWEVVTK